MRAQGKLVTLVAVGIGLALLATTLVSSLDSRDSLGYPVDRDARWTMHRISIVAILATVAAALLSFRQWVRDLEQEIRDGKENEDRWKAAYAGLASREEPQDSELTPAFPQEQPVTETLHASVADPLQEEECESAWTPVSDRSTKTGCRPLQKRIIHARDIIDDIRSGMTDAQLMEKYQLSSMGLQSAFSKLLNSRLLTVDEIYGQWHRDDENNTVIIDDPRNVPCRFLAVSVPLYEATQAERKGQLRDITEKGMNITGIDSRLGEVKQFVIPCQDFLEVSAIHFEAECRWVVPKQNPDLSSAGFQITNISRHDLAELRRLIGCLTFS